jgi:hypothetical protein
MAYSFIRAQIDRDQQAYKDKCKKNRQTAIEAAAKRSGKSTKLKKNDPVIDPHFDPADPSDDPRLDPFDPVDPSGDPNFDPNDPSNDPRLDPFDPFDPSGDPHFDPNDPSNDPRLDPFDPVDPSGDPNFDPNDPSNDPNFDPVDPVDPSNDPRFDPVDPSDDPRLDPFDPVDPSDDPNFDPNDPSDDPNFDPNDPSNDPRLDPFDPNDPSGDPNFDPPQTKKKSAQEDRFDQFWAAYPKKVKKILAKKKWMQIKPNKELFDCIMAAVQKQKTSIEWAKDGGQYIPHPTTWLNQGRWDDELTYTAPNAPSTRASPPGRDSPRFNAGAYLRQKLSEYDNEGG